MDNLQKPDKKYIKQTKTKEKIIFHPFSVGIPWVYKGSVIQPKIKDHIWDSVVLSKKDFITVSFGGLLESLLSLVCIESLSRNIKNHKLFWLGHEKYNYLIEQQKIAEISQIALKPNILTQYPSPLFFDADDNVYFNLLNNYRKLKKHTNDRPVFKQVIDNSFFSYSEINLRKSNIKEKRRQILIIPEDNNFSVHKDERCLKWSAQNVRELAAMLYGKNYEIIVATQNPHLFQTSRIKTINATLEDIIPIVKSCSMILSYEIDWLFSALLLNRKVSIVGLKPKSSCFDFFKNADFINSKNKLYINDGAIYPIDVFQICEIF